MKYYFVFGGTDSRELGVLIDTMPPVQRPRKRVTTVTVPGRAGVLTINESDEAYDTYVQSFNISVPGNKVHELIKALEGEKWLTLSNDPHRRQLAQVINAFSLKKVSKNLDWYTGAVAFECQPYKYGLADSTEVYESGEFINNDGDITERPVITVYGTGTLSVNIMGMGDTAEPFTVENVVGGCVIDCAAYMVTDLDGNIITAQSRGEFPTIPQAKRQYIFITGADSCSVKRAVRYL